MTSILTPSPALETGFLFNEETRIASAVSLTDSRVLKVIEKAVAASRRARKNGLAVRHFVNFTGIYTGEIGRGFVIYSTDDLRWNSEYRFDEELDLAVFAAHEAQP